MCLSGIVMSVFIVLGSGDGPSGSPKPSSKRHGLQRRARGQSYLLRAHIKVQRKTVITYVVHLFKDRFFLGGDLRGGRDALGNISQY